MLALTAVVLPLVVGSASPSTPDREPKSVLATPRMASRAESVLPFLQERRADVAWETTASWTDARGRPLDAAARQREAVRTALRLNDSNKFREAAAFSAEIDRRLAEAEAAAERAQLRTEIARILDLRATLAVAINMDTAQAREYRRRSAELAPERLPQRPRRKPSAAPAEDAETQRPNDREANGGRS